MTHATHHTTAQHRAAQYSVAAAAHLWEAAGLVQQVEHPHACLYQVKHVLVVHKLDVRPCDRLALVLGLLLLEDVCVEMLLQLLVGQVDAELLEVVGVKLLKAWRGREQVATGGGWGSRGAAAQVGVGRQGSGSRAPDKGQPQSTVAGRLRMRRPERSSTADRVQHTKPGPPAARQGTRAPSCPPLSPPPPPNHHHHTPAHHRYRARQSRSPRPRPARWTC